MNTPHQKLVADFVLGFFTGTPRTPPFDNVTRTEVCDVVLESLLINGHFPPNADMIAGDPPIYLGTQIRKLSDNEYIVTNIEFFAYASSGESSTRRFGNALDAVVCYVCDRVSNRMWGVDVL